MIMAYVTCTETLQMVLAIINVQAMLHGALFVVLLALVVCGGIFINAVYVGKH